MYEDKRPPRIHEIAHLWHAFDLGFISFRISFCPARHHRAYYVVIAWLLADQRHGFNIKNKYPIVL